MKKIIAVLSAAFLAGACAFAEGYICANDLEKGQVTAVTQEEDGFVLNASEEKAMTIDSMKAYTYNDETFTQRIKLNGAGKPDYRSISFPAKKGEKITIYGISGAKTETRPLLVVNSTGAEVAQVVMDMMPPDDGTLVPTVETVTVPADDTYTIYSKKSGINIFQIKVGN